MMTEPVRIYLSYAKEDAALADELHAHLQALIRQGQISVWDIRQVAAGEDWTTVRDHQLRSARMIVPLISASFLTSERCFGDLAVGLSRRRLGEAQVVPILIRACDWASSPLEELQMLPRNRRPVTSWSNRDEAWAEIARELRSFVEFGADRVQPTPIAAPPQVRSI